MSQTVSALAFVSASEQLMGALAMTVLLWTASVSQGVGTKAIRVALTGRRPPPFEARARQTDRWVAGGVRRSIEAVLPDAGLIAKLLIHPLVMR